MLFVEARSIATVDDAIELLQMAIGIEFSTLPPYLYALYSIRPDTNAVASSRIRAVAMEEMVHMCLACNILNALGTNPALDSADLSGADSGRHQRRRQRGADHPPLAVLEGRHGAGDGDRGAGSRPDRLSA